MKLSEENHSQEVETKKNSLSEPAPMKLKPYEFKPEDLSAFIKQYENVDPIKDMKTAKKARTAIKKKINEIKSVHTANKKGILNFKRDVEAYDKSKFEALTVDLDRFFNKLNTSIENIESAKEIRAMAVEDKIKSLNNDLLMDILEATTTEAINEVQVKINSITADKNEYDDKVGEVESLKTSLILKAAGREREIFNAGGTITSDKVVPMNIKPEGSPVEMSNGPSDTELLNFLQGAAASKGWICNINPNTGIQLYQVDDPKAPKSIREAIIIAKDKHESI